MENSNLHHSTGWISGFILRAAPWPKAQSNGQPRFLCQAPGEFAPLSEEATWTLRLGSPEQRASDICRVCCQGVRMGIGSEYADICLGPEGTLTGILPAGITPTLFSVTQETMQDEDGLFYIESPSELVLLRVEPQNTGMAFALLTCAPGSKSVGVRLLQETIQEIRPTEELNREFAARDALIPALSENGGYTAAALDVLIGNLRPATDRMPFRWIAKYEDNGSEVFDINEALIEAFAWLDLDERCVVDAIRSCTSVIRADGCLPAHVDPLGIRPPSSEAAWPILGQLCLRYFEQSRDSTLMDEINPSLREYGKALLTRYRQEGSDIPSWSSPEEALVPELWDERVASTDLIAMLVIELSALVDLYGRVPGPGIDLSHLQTQRDHLVSLLTDHFWNAPQKIFTDRFLPETPEGKWGEYIRRISLGSYFPLGIPELSTGYRHALAAHLDSAASLLSADGLQHWQSWEEDEELPRVEAAQQALAFLLLRLYPTAWVHLRKNLKETLQHFLVCGSGFPHDLRLARNEEGSPLPVESPQAAQNGAAASLYLMIEASERAVSGVMESAPPSIRFLERHRSAVVYTVIALFLAVLLGVPTFFIKQSSHRGVSTYLKTQEAETAYRMGHFDRTIELYTELIQNSEDKTQTQHYQVQLARTYFNSKDYAKAREWYAKIVEARPEDAKMHLNLGITFFHERRYPEAMRSIQQALQLADKDSEELVQKAKDAIRLITPRLDPTVLP